MTKQTNSVATVNAIQITPKNFKAINAPKLNSITVSCLAIASIAQAAKTDGTVTRLGHKANCKGGIIDTVILEGKATTMQSFISALRNSGLKNVNDDMAKFASDTADAVLAKRVTDHVNWCANTLNDTHGGFGSRLDKVALTGKRAEIAKNLSELASVLGKVYSVQYAGLYKNRNKAVK